MSIPISTTPLTVDRNVYNAIRKAVDDKGMTAPEIAKIEKAILKNGVTADEQTLLDGLKDDKYDESISVKVRTSDKDPVYEITTFPKQSPDGERMSFGEVDTAPYDIAKRQCRAEIIRGNDTIAIDWLDSTDVNRLIDEIPGRELDKLLKLASKQSPDSPNSFPAEKLMTVLAEKLNAESGAKLFAKLSIQGKSLLMDNLTKMAPDQQNKLVAALGLQPQLQP